MRPHLERRGSKHQWSFPALLAAILIVAQCLAVGHFHPSQTASRYSSAATSLNENDGWCALCSFQQYPRAVAAAAPFPFSCTIIEDVEPYAAQSLPLYAFNSYLWGRSPPALA
jgi:hypothetical protein